MPYGSYSTAKRRSSTKCDAIVSSNAMSRRLSSFRSPRALWRILSRYVSTNARWRRDAASLGPISAASAEWSPSKSPASRSSRETVGRRNSQLRWCSRSVAVHRGGNVGLVAGRVGQRPPGGRELVSHHAAARGERRRDARLRLFVGHPYRDVDRATAVPTRLTHSLEPERRSTTVRIDEVFVGAVATRLIPEHGAPERHHLGGNGRARDDEQALKRRRVGGETKRPGDCGDLAGELDVTPGHPGVVVADREHANGHTVMPHVNVGALFLDARQLADRLHEPGACCERTAPEVRARAVAEHAPILDAFRLTELLRADPVVHADLLVTEQCSWSGGRSNVGCRHGCGWLKNAPSWKRSRRAGATAPTAFR